MASVCSPAVQIERHSRRFTGERQHTVVERHTIRGGRGDGRGRIAGGYAMAPYTYRIPVPIDTIELEISGVVRIHAGGVEVLVLSGIDSVVPVQVLQIYADIGEGVDVT